MEKLGSERDEFTILHSLRPVQVKAADGRDLRPLYDPDGPSAGIRLADLGDPGDIDDGRAANAIDLFRVQLIGQCKVFFSALDFGGAAGGVAVLAPVRRTC